MNERIATGSSPGNSHDPVAYLRVVALENDKYMQFTTFRRDGRAVSTPVWLVQLPEGEIGFSTGSDSGKAKRLSHTALAPRPALIDWLDRDASGGKLFLSTAMRAEDQSASQRPWPLKWSELEWFSEEGLVMTDRLDRHDLDAFVHVEYTREAND
jgi:hypothetical protein